MEIKLFITSYMAIRNQCYLIYKNGNGILVDPSWNYELIDDYLIEHAITLKGVLLTHSHEDHTNLAQKFAQNYKAPVFLSAIEAGDYAFECENLQRIHHLEELVIADLKIIPIHTPGHTTGSICYLTGDHIFCGDTFFTEGVGICNLKGGCADKMFDSVQYIKNYVPEHVLFWPGHSFGQQPGKSLKYLLKNNMYFQLDKREHFVDFRMRKKQPNPFNFY
jgi:hydroxyacylglutathione hydrolase